MRTFKTIDLLLQILIIVATIATYIVNSDDSLTAFLFAAAVFYIGLAVWQPISAIVHLIHYKWRTLPLARKVYFIMLPVALVVCLVPVGTSTPDSAVYSLIAGFSMAMLYFIITVTEVIKSKKVAP
jgi:hypothetical protein